MSELEDLLRASIAALQPYRLRRPIPTLRGGRGAIRLVATHGPDDRERDRYIDQKLSGWKEGDG